MKKTVHFLMLLLLVLSCKNETKKEEPSKEIMAAHNFEKIEQLYWLIGSWTNITEEEQSYENWVKSNDSTLKAHSFTIVAKDTVFEERITVQQNGIDLSFTAQAYGQNDDTPITFKIISSKEGVFTFENPEHDFPTRISYSNPDRDSIHAWIEGTVEGNARKVDFYFKRGH